MTSRPAEPHAPGLQPRDGARLVTDVEGPPTGPRELGERSKSCPQRLTRRWARGAGWSLLIALAGSAHAQENTVQLSGKAIARTGVIAHGTPACASSHGMSGERVAVQDGARLAGQIADRMLELGVYVTPFSFPVVPRGEARIRVQLSAAHSEDDVRTAVEAFTKARADVA